MPGITGVVVVLAHGVSGGHHHHVSCWCVDNVVVLRRCMMNAHKFG